MADWVCGVCKSINRSASGKCYSCGGVRANVAVGEAPGYALPTSMAAANAPAASGMATAPDAASTAPGVTGAPPMAAGGGTPTPDGGTFGAPMSLAAEAVQSTASAPAGPAGFGNLLGGFLGGTVAALVASGVWYAVVTLSQYQVGIVAIAVGWLVGMGVVYGAGHRGSFALIPISVILTLIALVTSEYLIVAHFFSLDVGYAVDLLQSPDFIAEVVIASVQADPLTLVFWAIALFQAFVIPARVPRVSAPPTPTPGPTDAPATA